jgi:hypothetical protein
MASAKPLARRARRSTVGLRTPLPLLLEEDMVTECNTEEGPYSFHSPSFYDDRRTHGGYPSHKVLSFNLVNMAVE